MTCTDFKNVRWRLQTLAGVEVNIGDSVSAPSGIPWTVEGGRPPSPQAPAGRLLVVQEPGTNKEVYPRAYGCVWATVP